MKTIKGEEMKIQKTYKGKSAGHYIKNSVSGLNVMGNCYLWTTIPGQGDCHIFFDDQENMAIHSSNGLVCTLELTENQKKQLNNRLPEYLRRD